MKTVASRLGLGARRTPIDPRAPGLTMPAAVSYFARRPSAIFLFAMLVLALAVRLWLGEFRVWDAVLAASLVGIHPLTEWFIHVDTSTSGPARGAGTRSISRSPATIGPTTSIPTSRAGGSSPCDRCSRPSSPWSRCRPC